MTGLAAAHRRIENFIGQGRKAEAVALVFRLIVQSAKARDFETAYALREKLFEIDPMALAEMVKSAEIIEDEKRGALEQRHLNIWKKLYSALLPEEADALYFKLEEARYDAGAPVFQQGRNNRRLYFIDRGELKLVCREGAEERLLRALGPGTIAGGDTFFSVSVCTTSLVTLGPCRMRQLDHVVYAEWQQSMPSLAAKLADYFSRTTKDHELLREQAINRRRHDRLKVKGVLRYVILNADGAPITDVFKGALSDISRGGISFFIKIAKPEIPRMLLGRRLRVEFSIPSPSGRPLICETGVVIGVIDRAGGSYSIHLRFDRELAASAVPRHEVES
jgi:CRP-like cAMP-binding protein